MATPPRRPPLVLLLFPLFLLHASAAPRCHPDDESALLAFKSAASADPAGLLSSWIPATDCCTWSGVACRVDSRVTELSLSADPTTTPSSSLSATIPSSFSTLRRLTGLYFTDLRNLTGPFPPALYRLPDLAYVYIINSRLSGPIPPDIGRRLANLAALSLAGNAFSGPIPPSVKDMTHLIQLDLSRNALSGTVPAFLSRLKNLTLLSLEGNSLSGTIPDLSPLADLRSLALSRNRLSGRIPPSLAAHAPRLKYLLLANNRFTGPVPDYLGAFTALDTLDLSGNKLTGPVPATFANLTKLFNLNLSGNRLTDPFPQMAIKGIESLDLSRNNLHLGRIPSWAISSPIIYSLKLARCGIRMRMEDFNPKETYYYDYIDLSENDISGSPAGLLNRTGWLKEFRAAGNKLRFDLGRLRVPGTLRALDVSRNMVYGEVTAAVAAVEGLNVSYNHLCGRIPPTRAPASAFAGNDCLCGRPLSPCRRRV